MPAVDPPPTLSFVVIAYNAAGLIRSTLDHLLVAVERADWHGLEVVVVDDGSTDDPVAIVEEIAATTETVIRVHRQPNQGRLAASRAGTELAHGTLVSFIGERVLMHPDSLRNLRSLLVEHPEARVWNCHIEIPRERNPQAQFWYVLTFLGWRRYLARPRLVSFGQDDFDYYPKGTGGFVCPRGLLLEAYGQLVSLYDDEKSASDDTTLIRWIAARERIWMAPDYAADYLSRSGFRDFARHSFHRGTFILDSYLHPGTRLFAPLIAYFVLSPLALLAVLKKPRLLLAAPAAWLAAALGFRRMGVSSRDVRGFSLLAPVFAVVFSAGMWRGLWGLARAKVSVSLAARARGHHSDRPSGREPGL